MASCKVCLTVIKKNQFKVQCRDCGQEFHGKCVNIGQADVDFLQEQGTGWRCDPCNKSRRKSMRLEYTEGGLTLETIMTTLKEMQEEQKKNTADFNKSYELMYDKLEDNTEVVKTGMKKIQDYIQLIEDLKSENAALKSKVAYLELRVEDMENYSRRNCLEIQGIPERKDEEVAEVLKEVGKALDMDIVDDMIDACHRIGKKTSDRPRAIIVKFVRRTDKEKMMARRREQKRDFSTRHLGQATDVPIYVNDSLSQTRRRLLAQARQLKKDKAYKYIWNRNGNFLLRKEEESPVVEIRTQADLSKL